MYTVTRLHKLPTLKQINLKFFFNEYKIKNDFFNDNPLFLSLKETGCKNFAAALSNPDYTCVREYTRKSSYTIPSFFVYSKDEKEIKQFIRNDFLKPYYKDVSKKLRNAVSVIFDIMTEEGLDYKKYRKVVIDYCYVQDLNKKEAIKHYNNIKDLIVKNMTAKSIIGHIKFVEEEKIRIRREFINKNRENAYSSFVNKVIEAINNLSILENINNKEINKNAIKEILLKMPTEQKENLVYENKFNKILTNKIAILNELDKNFNNEQYLDLINNFNFKNLKKENNSLSKEVLSQKIIENWINNNKCKKYVFKEDIGKSKTLLKITFEKDISNFYSIDKMHDIVSIDGEKINKELSDFIKNIEQNIKNYISEEWNKYTKTTFKDDNLKESIVNIISKLIIKEINQQKKKKFVYNLRYKLETEKNGYDLEKIKINILKNIFKLNNINIIKYFENYIVSSNLKIESFKDIYKEARNRKRELIYLSGETNSGKTYSAFEELKKYKSGVYLAPLRLLALEGQEEIEKRGLKCNMVTGEEQNIKEGSNFTSSTIEMLDYTKKYDVAIIDEVQMLADPDRTSAWLEAIIGVNAKKVILVGSSEVSDSIIQISNYLNEPLSVKTFKRKTTLSFEKKLYTESMNKFGKLPKNSAVIAFSKRDIENIKINLEAQGNKVSVIYGALPPEVRRSESERFKNGETDVVVATDAIGMGLNLPIKNLFFYDIMKFNGQNMEYLNNSLIKQIVGRAGRFNMFDIGKISTFSEQDFNFIKKRFNERKKIKNIDYKTRTSYSILNQIKNISGETKMFKLLQFYKNHVKFDFNIQNHNPEYAYSISMYLDNKDKKDSLSLYEKTKLLNAPIPSHKYKVYLDFFKDMIDLLLILRTSHKTAKMPYINNSDDYETQYKKLDVISWICFNFKEFEHLNEVVKQRKTVIQNIWKKELKK